MSETTDPVLDAVRDAARVQDCDLDTAEVRAAIARITPPPRRRPARVALVTVAAAAVVVAGVGCWHAVAPSGPPITPGQGRAGDLTLVAARFDAAATRFTLPPGQSYDALRKDVLAGATGGTEPDPEFVVGEGRMPTEGANDSTEAMTALLARYSGCQWWRVETAGTFDELSPREQAEVRARNREAGAEVLEMTRDRAAIPLTELWDELCKDAG